MVRGSKADEIFTVVFMLVAVASVAIVFITNQRPLFFWVAGIAVVLRIIQYILRIFK